MASDPAEPGARRAARVRLAIGALSPLTRQAIDSAVRLAAEGQGRLDCVFVEDADLFRAASLPLTREFGVATSAARSFDARDLAGALRKQAERARQEVERAAHAARLGVSFEVARGALLDEALQRAGAQDLLVVAAAGLDPEEATPPRRPGTTQALTLLALVESLPADSALLRAALRAVPGASLALWAAGEAAQSAAALEAECRLLERELGRPLRRVQAGAPAEVGALLAALSQSRARMLAIRRETLAALAGEVGWCLRRRSAVLVAAPGEQGR